MMRRSSSEIIADVALHAAELGQAHLDLVKTNVQHILSSWRSGVQNARFSILCLAPLAFFFWFYFFAACKELLIEFVNWPIGIIDSAVALVALILFLGIYYLGRRIHREVPND